MNAITMKHEIIAKLRPLLETGIRTEAEALYLMAEIRTLLEQEGLKRQYGMLTFHADWMLHSKLEGRAAQQLLQHFDTANIQLKQGLVLHQLPSDLRQEIERASRMSDFEMELDAFLKYIGLPSINAARRDGWIHFHHLYTQVVEHRALIISNKNPTSSIESVTVHFEIAKEAVGDEMPFKVTWTILDKNGKSGEIFVLNSYSLKP